MFVFYASWGTDGERFARRLQLCVLNFNNHMTAATKAVFQQQHTAPALRVLCGISRGRLGMADDEAAEASAHQEEEVPLTEGAKEALKEELKDFLRELTKFTLWVLELTFVALSSRNSVQMHNAALFLRSTFNLAEGAEGGPSSTGEGFWPYIIAATEKINIDDSIASERPASKFRKLRGITVLGSRLRQVRVPGAPCSAFYAAVQAASPVNIRAPCFGAAGVLSSSGTFTKEWREDFM